MPFAPQLHCTLLALWSGAQVWAAVIWIGLALLSVSLLVLMRTRWGQAQPLSKCVALSILAHVLFLSYAYTTRLFLDAPAVPHDDVIRLNLLATDDRAQEYAKKSEAPKPWEQTADVVPQPPQPDVERAGMDQGHTEQRSLSAVDPPLALETDDRLAAELQPSTDAFPLPQPVAENPRPVPPQPLDVPPHVADARETVPEESPPLEVPSEVPRRDVVTELTGQISPESDPAQRLADAIKAINAVDALPGFDQLEESMNRGAAPTESTEAKLESSDNQLVAIDVPVRASVGDRFPSDLPGTEAAALDSRPAPRRLGDGQPVPPPYQMRLANDRMQWAMRFGGNQQTQQAVERALVWMAAHQEPDGRWDASRFGAGREVQALGHDRGGAGSEADTGITGLALLAFLGAGHTHLEGKYRENVQHGLEFLLRSQATDGNLAGDARLFASMYCHGMASLAISEAYAISGDSRIRPFLERAVQYSVDAQHRTSGGWRYQPGDMGDMSQFGWQVMALISAELGGVTLPASTRSGMDRFLRRSASGTHGGLAGYRFGDRPSRTMTAEAMACRGFLGWPDDPLADLEGTRFLMDELPGQGQVDLYYWYYGTLALFQRQGDGWQRWNEALQRELLRLQRSDGPDAGSWDPDTVWGSYGGRVYSTALAALCLESYYRYLPLTAGDGHPEARAARR